MGPLINDFTLVDHHHGVLPGYIDLQICRLGRDSLHYRILFR